MFEVLIAGLAIFAAAEGDDAMSRGSLNVERFAQTLRGEPSLTAYWRMEGDLKDEISGAAWGGEGARFAKRGDGSQVLVLDGQAPVVFEDAEALETKASTVSLLFRIMGMGEANPCLLAMRDDTGTRFSLHVSRDRRGVGMWNGTGVRWGVLPTGMTIEDGRWYYLAAVSGGDEGFALYLDGARCFMNGFGGFNAATKKVPLVLGAATPGNLEGAPCELDELAFFDEALPGQTIAAFADALGIGQRREELAALFTAIRTEREKEQEKAKAARDDLRQAMLNDPSLFERGTPRVYQGEHLGAISLPVGGIGAGLIQMNGQGAPHIWQIHNNHAGVKVPGCFLAIAMGQGEDAVVRALQTEGVPGFEPMAALTFEGRYPFGWYAFQDEALPGEVSLEVFNPLIPLNEKDSGIPCAIFTIRVRNTTDAPMPVTLLGSQQNAVGLSPLEPVDGLANSGYGGNMNVSEVSQGMVALHMTQPRAGAACAANDGEAECAASRCCPPGTPSASMTLALMDDAGRVFTQWDEPDRLGAFMHGEEIQDAAAATPASAPGRTHQGAAACNFTVAPGAEAERTFVLAWFLPNEEAGRWSGQGLMYTNWWNSSLEVARYVAARLPELRESTQRYVDTLYASNLPYWMLDRISSQVAVLRTKTCYWSRDGYFGGWEGCCPGGGCCDGNCAHVWHYAQAHARLFPQLAKRMREQALAFDKEGGILFRQKTEWEMVAIDGQCGEILGAYREYLCSTGDAWLRGQWPRIQRAMDYTIERWDADGDGMLHGVLHNTLDVDSTGTGSWWGSLYLAALQASAAMARVAGTEEQAERYMNIWEQGRENQDKALWNGAYYAQVAGEEPLYDYMNGCSIDLALGEWWAGQTGLATAYPDARVKTALRALFHNNFQPNFHGVQQSPRKFVSDGDAGMQMITWPGNDRPTPHTLYADEVMSGFEYSAAATMIQYGLLREGFTAVKAIAGRYDGRIRRDVTDAITAAWGYTGNPFGDDECGKFYARAMSSWSLLTACQGFVYEGPKGRIGFQPVWRPDDHGSFFTAAEGWGLYRQQRNRDTQNCSIKVSSGRVEVAEFIGQTAEGRTVREARAEVNGTVFPAEFTQEGTSFVLRLAAPIVLRAEDAFETVLQFADEA